jgi:hypothetical protein
MATAMCITALTGTLVAQTPNGATASSSVKKVESTVNGRRRVVSYDAAGKVVEVSEEVLEKDLPKPVADAIHAHRRAIYVSGIKVTRGSNVEYRLTVRGSRRTAMVAKPDGKVLSFK